MKRNFRILAGAVLLALSPLAHAQEAVANPGQERVTTRLATSFTPLAGSPENARALVTALRNGTEVTLLTPPEGGTGDPVATTFTPPTKPMGWGNVSHSLSLAQDSLARLGITNPTNAELQAALMGGEITAPDGSAVALRGILQMRADGMGWGNIARASGTTMGAVVSSTRAMQGKAPVAASTATGVTTAAGTPTTVAGGKSAKGITTAAGAATSAGKGPTKGITTASGAAPGAASRGLVTAEGASAGHGRSAGITTASAGSGGGNAYGRGLVTASGGAAGAGVTATAAHGRGAGLVSATGASAGSSAITTAAGPGNGRGQANGKGKGG